MEGARIEFSDRKTLHIPKNKWSVRPCQFSGGWRGEAMGAIVGGVGGD